MENGWRWPIEIDDKHDDLAFLKIVISQFATLVKTRG